MSLLQPPVDRSGVLWIAREVQAALQEEADRWGTRETGGVLLGYWGCGSGDPVVTHCVGPGADAKHCEKRFEPDWQYQLKEIGRLYQKSGRLLHYLGDWHSHPDGDGVLSELDRRTLRTIARCREARVARPVMLIMAGGPQWDACAWQFHKAHNWLWTRVTARELLIRAFANL